MVEKISNPPKIYLMLDKVFICYYKCVHMDYCHSICLVLWLYYCMVVLHFLRATTLIHISIYCHLYQAQIHSITILEFQLHHNYLQQVSVVIHILIVHWF